ncbi:uncharacterized protein V6R79_025944 [Siganus canaliculatus]
MHPHLGVPLYAPTQAENISPAERMLNALYKEMNFPDSDVPDVQTSHLNKPAALRVIVQDHMIDKLVLPCGVPETVDELQSIVQQKYNLEAGKFTLHYKDVDFGGEFFSLASTKDLKDKDTIKSNTVEIRREVAIRCLVVYLGENEDSLFEYVDSESNIGDLESRVMKILVTKDATTFDPASATIMIEGTEVLQGVDVPRACALLMGLIYALNLSYPRELKYTCEVFQKVFLKLDSQKSSPKVTSLKQKLIGNPFEPQS